MPDSTKEKSYRLAESLLPSEWIVRRLARDDGVDLEIELADQGVITGNRIWVHIKSLQQTTRATVTYQLGDRFPDVTDKNGTLAVEYVPYAIGTRELEYSLQCPFPLLLFLVDLSTGEILWLPLRDEIVTNVNEANPEWRLLDSATVRLPLWNRLTTERSHGYTGLRWYAMEPARLCAFAMLHYYHHDFQYNGRLSGYEIGEGWMDEGQRQELLSSLRLARMYLRSALELDVLFGEHGMEFFKLDSLPGLPFPGIVRELSDAIRAADTALEHLTMNSYEPVELSTLVGGVLHAMNLLSTVIASYQGFRGRHLLTEGSAVWRSAMPLHGLDGAPVLPMSRRPLRGRACLG